MPRNQSHGQLLIRSGFRLLDAGWLDLRFHAKSTNDWKGMSTNMDPCLEMFFIINSILSRVNIPDKYFLSCK